MSCNGHRNVCVSANQAERNVTMKTNATRWMTAAVAAATVAFGFWTNSQAATIAYVGSETSNTSTPGAWGATTATGYKGDYRSTDSSTKAWTLPDKPNAYGTDGYIIFGSSNYTQEADGSQYEGSLYTGSRSGQNFNNPTAFVTQASIQGTWSGGNSGVLNRWTIFDGGPSMDDPTLGVGVGVTNITHGSLWWRYDGTNATKDLLLITMGDAPPSWMDVTIRIGIQTNRGDGQKPAAIALGGVSHATTGQNAYSRPDWYFFDITDWTSGETFYLTVTAANGVTGSSGIGALVFDTIVTIPEPTSAALLALAGLALLRQRR